MTVTIPYGDGEAVVTGTFIEPVFTRWNCPMEDAEEGCPGEFDVSSFVVGGVDILEEVVDTYVQVVDAHILEGKRVDKLAFRSRWEQLVDRCYEKAYNEILDGTELEEYKEELLSELY